MEWIIEDFPHLGADPRMRPQENVTGLDTAPLEYLRGQIDQALDWELTLHLAHTRRLARTANERVDPYLKQADCTNYITGLVRLLDLFLRRFRWQEAQNVRNILDKYGVEVFNSGGDSYWRLRRR